MDGRRRFLIVEASPEDAELQERGLRKGGLEFTSLRVQTRDRLVDALRNFKPHLVICDFNLPALDGMSALRAVRSLDREIPFIFVSPTIGEERAIDGLKSGVTDYVFKDHINSLASKVERALLDAEDRQKQRTLELEQRQAQKLEAIERFAGGVAHDFSNLLTTIMGHTDLMLSRVRPEESSAEELKEVMTTAQRGVNLTRQLLAISRRQVLAPVVFNLNDHVRQTTGILERIIGDDIELVTRLEPDLGSILADPGQMEQIIIYLAGNARDAMPKGGKLVMETSNVYFDAARAREHPGVIPGPHVRLTVTDTGLGMSAETKSHLFEPFVSTKEPGKGSGLALSTVHGIVRQSGGSIEIWSELRRGTSIRLNFPQVKRSVDVPRKPAVTATSSGGSGVILVAEDFDPLRKIIQYVLEREGFRVLSAPDGVEAVRLSKAHEGRIHLLMTDVIMPRMGGLELADHLMRARPDMRVLYTSVMADQAGLWVDPSKPPIEFLAKPFMPDEMIRKVREVMGVAAKR